MTSKSKPNPSEQRKAIEANQAVLAAELSYIGQMAFQANEDRQRVAQFFFISFGSFIAAILSLQIDEATVARQDIFFILFFVFLFVAFFGAVTLRQLARLRLAWLESVQAMNRLKVHLQDAYNPNLDGVFEWLAAPDAYKRDSVGHYQAIQVAVGAGIAVGVSAAFLVLALRVNWHLSVVVVFAVVLGLLAAYFLFVRYFKKVLLND